MPVRTCVDGAQRLALCHLSINRLPLTMRKAAGMTGLFSTLQREQGRLSSLADQPRGQLSLVDALRPPVRQSALSGFGQHMVPKNGLVMGEKAFWLGYDFSVYQRYAYWCGAAGLYILAGLSTNNQGSRVWRPFYIGQCQSFAGYIPTHRKWPEAERLGATHVHARVEQGVLARQHLEAELIQQYQPPLNVQLR